MAVFGDTRCAEAPLTLPIRSRRQGDSHEFLTYAGSAEKAKPGNAQSPLFVRRAPEDYEKPKRMASALTARLSQPQEQSRSEECGFDGGGSRSFLCRGPLAGEMLPGSLKQWRKDLAGGTPSTQADETVDLTVHVQSPFEVPTVVNPVPGCMTLASLRNEVCHTLAIVEPETLEPGTPPPPSVLALNHFSGGSEISAGARTPAASGICGRKVTFDALSDDDKTPTAAWHRRTDDACHTGTAKAPTDNVCPCNGQAVQQKKSEIFNVRTRSDSDVMKRPDLARTRSSDIGFDVKDGSQNCPREFFGPCSSAFFFNESTASIRTEYLVTVAVRGARARPLGCTLIIDRQRLRHQPREQQDAGEAQGTFMLRLNFWGRHARPPTQAQNASEEVALFAERSIRDVRAVSCNESEPRIFSVMYRGSTHGGAHAHRSAELTYQATTPLECAEIVARLHYLVSL